MNPFYEQRTAPLFIGKITEDPFPLHVHKVVECVHLLEGRITMGVDGHSYAMQPGDTMFIFPSVSHSYEVVSEDAKGLCAIFLPDTIAEFSDAFFTRHPVTPFLPAAEHSPRLTQAIQRLVDVSTAQETALYKAYLHVFLAHLFQEMAFEPLKKHIDIGLTQQVLQHISQHYREDITLESVARDLGVSQSHLSHIFSSQLRINFRRYINTLRIDYACTLLRDTTMSVTEICYACGYNNPRTFHRAFQEEHSMQPGEFREMNRNRTN